MVSCPNRTKNLEIYLLQVLIGIAPCGLINFISKAYGGRITDSQLTVDAGVLDKLESGDEVMLDKGFPDVSEFLYKVTNFHNNFLIRNFLNVDVRCSIFFCCK